MVAPPNSTVLDNPAVSPGLYDADDWPVSRRELDERSLPELTLKMIGKEKGLLSSTVNALALSEPVIEIWVVPLTSCCAMTTPKGSTIWKVGPFSRTVASNGCPRGAA